MSARWYKPRRRRNLRRFVALRLLLVVPLLVATLVLHLSGTDLVILKIARIILLAAVIGGLAYLRRRKQLDELSDGGTVSRERIGPLRGPPASTLDGEQTGNEMHRRAYQR